MGTTDIDNNSPDANVVFIVADGSGLTAYALPKNEYLKQKILRYGQLCGACAWAERERMQITVDLQYALESQPEEFVELPKDTYLGDKIRIQMNRN